MNQHKNPKSLSQYSIFNIRYSVLGGFTPPPTFSQRKLVGGFNMVELLITISILAIMTTVALANFRTFGKKSELSNTAESVVLALRQAQVYGVTTKGGGAPCGGSSFDCAYGVHVDASTNPQKIIIFADADDDSKYTNGELVETIPLSGVTISVSCMISSFLVADCGPGYRRLDVTFKRPSPDAIIYGFLGPNYQSGSITLTAGVNTVTVTVTETGQISLK